MSIVYVRKVWLLMIEVMDYVDVRQRAQELGLNIPSGLALLPRNFETAASKDELLHEDPVSTIRSLWRQAGIQESRLEPPGERFDHIQEKSIEWIGPSIFIGAALMSENSAVVAVALNVISNYLSDVFFKGLSGKHTAKFDVVVEEPGGRCKRVHFEGTQNEFSELPAVIREVANL